MPGFYTIAAAQHPNPGDIPVRPERRRLQLGGRFSMNLWKLPDRAEGYKKVPDYRLSSANEKWYKTGTDGYFCEFRRWRATRFSFKRASVRPSLPSFTEPRLSAGRQ